MKFRDRAVLRAALPEIANVSIRVITASVAGPPIAPAHACCWPMWSHTERPGNDPRFCDAPISKGSYCQAHYDVAYLPDD